GAVTGAGAVPPGWPRHEIDATPRWDPPSTALIVIVVDDVMNCPKLGVPNCSVVFGTNGAHPSGLFDQYGATRKKPPSDGSDVPIGIGAVGCWDAGGSVGGPTSWQSSAPRAHI